MKLGDVEWRSLSNEQPPPARDGATSLHRADGANLARLSR